MKCAQKKKKLIENFAIIISLMVNVMRDMGSGMLVWFEQSLAFGLLQRLMNTLVVSLWRVPLKAMTATIAQEYYGKLRQNGSLVRFARNRNYMTDVTSSGAKMFVSYVCSIFVIEEKGNN